MSLTRYALLLAGLLVVNSQAMADRADLDAELQRYIKIFTVNNFSEQRPVFDDLA